MYKIISQRNIIQTATIINNEGKNVVACIMPKGSTLSRQITPSLQKLLDSRLIRVVEVEDSKPQSNANDSGSFKESITITEKEQPITENNESENSSNVSESDAAEDSPKRRGRKKKVEEEITTPQKEEVDT